MSAREYFDLRYTVPGFTFVLIIVGLNYSVVTNLIVRQGGTGDVLSVALAILTLFASSAIGFLISQIWFGYYHFFRIYAKIIRKKDRKLEDSLTKNFGWIKKEKPDKENDYTLGSAVDYVLNKQENENLFKFFQRKIDLFHTMSSVCTSIILGIIIGFPTRSLLFLSGRYSFNSNFDIFIYIVTIISAMSILRVLLYLRQEIFFEYHPIMKVLFDNDVDKEELNEKMIKTFEGYFTRTPKPDDSPPPEV